jgi:hypothetical protein
MSKIQNFKVVVTYTTVSGVTVPLESGGGSCEMSDLPNKVAGRVKEAMVAVGGYPTHMVRELAETKSKLVAMKQAMEVISQAKTQLAAEAKSRVKTTRKVKGK